MPDHIDERTGEKSARHARTIAEYVAILARWRAPVFIFTGVVLVGTAVYMWVFSSNVYESVAAIKSSIVTQLNESGIGNILNSQGLGNIGGLLGIGKQQSDLDQDIGVLQSTSVLGDVVKRYDLLKEYNVRLFDDAVKTLSDNVKFSTDRESQILNISVQDTSPVRAQLMCKTFVSLLDSVNKDLAQRNARNTEEYLQIRYDQCVNDLGAAEDSLKLFQLRYKVYDMKDQAMASIKVAADLEGQIMLKEAQANILAKTMGENDAETRQAFAEANELKRQRRQMDTGLALSSALQSIVPFAKAPQLGLEYFRRYRNVEIQEKLFALIYPLYEQSKVEVERNTPTLLVLDPPSLPERKVKPHRTIITLLITLAAFFIAYFAALSIENIRRFSRMHPEQYAELKISLEKIVPRIFLRWM